MSETSEIDNTEEVKNDPMNNRQNSEDRGLLKARSKTVGKAPLKLQKNEFVTTQYLLQRKYLNINRWNCISRP